MDASTFRNIQILAIRDVEYPSWDSFYRKVCRWYSREFHVPLNQMDTIPELEVIRTYYEDQYEKLQALGTKESQEEFERIKNAVILGPDKYKQEESESEDEEEAWAQELREEVERAWSKQQAKPTDQSQPKSRDDGGMLNPNLISQVESYTSGGEDGFSTEE